RHGAEEGGGHLRVRDRRCGTAARRGGTVDDLATEDAMSKSKVLIAAGLVALAGVLPSALAGPAQEPPRVCEGLTICSPVGGPWVVVPGPIGREQATASVWMLG